MQKSCVVVCLVFMVLLFCSKEPKKITITGAIHIVSGLPTEPFHIGLYEESGGFFFGEPFEFIDPEDSTFTVEIEPYKAYSLVAYSFEYEQVNARILVPSNKVRTLHIDFYMQPMGVPESISEVYVIGDFNGWQATEGYKMQRQGEVWVLPEGRRIVETSRYKFQVDNQQRFDLSESNKAINPTYANYDNKYSGKQLVFDPSLYQRPQKPSIYKVSGSPVVAGYIELKGLLYEFDDKLTEPLRQSEPLTPAKGRAVFEKSMAYLDSLEAAYDPGLAQMFIEPRLRVLEFYDPNRLRIQEIYQIFGLDTTRIAGFMASDTFAHGLATTTDLLARLDHKSYFVTGDFFRTAMTYLPWMIQSASAMGVELNVDTQQYADKVNYFIDHAQNPECRQNCALQSWRYYREQGDMQRADELETLILTKYPDSFAAENLKAQKEYVNWQDVAAAPAPDFTLMTVDGQEFTLSKNRGKYVFIDFWGTWCGPCKMELPNIIRLAETIPSDKLIVFGVARDEPGDLQKFLHKRPLPYPNAIATENVLKAWKIEHFPTTFLIDPDGNIIAKEIRGAKMAERIAEEMKKYEAGS
ncbi:redoxin domain-containing protein [candidate division KSB1 bacterium]|nr:redoxin domain-containing protein [candidate division KSB1 bacterium]